MQNGTMRKLFAVLLVFTATTPAVADYELPIPADEFVYCTVCHGVQLMGNPIIRAPRLSGMDSWYVENQLHAFKKGWRGKHERDLMGMDMQPMAASLTDEQIKEVSAFVAATRSDMPPETITGDAEKGRTNYSTCTVCHGVRGEGNVALGSPALTGLNDWYLVRQLEISETEAAVVNREILTACKCARQPDYCQTTKQFATSLNTFRH